MGIDYGRGLTNVSNKLVPGVDERIRFGVVPQNEVLQAWCDEAEAWYGIPSCPECGVGLDFDFCDGDTCDCGYEVGHVGDECFGDDPLSHYIDNGEYVAESDSYGDIMIVDSPYYTRSGFCSPCAPGAGYVNGSGDDCYAFCFSPDWYDEEPDFPIFRVSDGSRVN